jgi:acetate kinase
MVGVSGMRVLVFNGGSSSLKASVYAVGSASHEAEPAKAEWQAALDVSPDALQKAPADLLKKLPSPKAIDAVGHRIVNGGKAFPEPARITPEVKATLASLAASSPQHNALEMAGIAAAEHALGPRVPQVAVFDSAFHATLPPAAYTYPGPSAWIEQGIRRFGFHGISHRYVAHRAARLLQRPIEELKLITCHLGNGCSLAAVSGGKSIDTTMGFTPLEGLMMGTRSGSIDPGILIYLMRRDGATADALDRVLNRESGFQGLAGSSDMRQVMAAVEQGDARAKLALDVFVHRLCAEMGAMLASLGGVDAMVFTGGIGENVPQVRERACRQFAFLGAVPVLPIHTEEDWEIARETRRVLA